MNTLWLTKLLLSHLLTDFVLQPRSWVEERRKLHFRSPKLYLHSFIAGFSALVFVGLPYWPYALAILVSHFLIDSWKSYRPATLVYFFTDQTLHILVILASWIAVFYSGDDWSHWLADLGANRSFWIVATGFIFLTLPAGIAIGQLTKPLSEGLPGGEGLANAGKWIGILERTLILVFMLHGQFSAIAFLITAKGLLRFSESGRQEEKTEYVLIGTLLSVLMAVITGLLIKRFL